MLDKLGKPLGYEQLTVVSATALTVPDTNPRVALLQAETQNIRWRDDGTEPDASTGMLLIAGDPPTLYGGSLTAIRFIQVAASAKLNVSYYK